MKTFEINEVIGYANRDYIISDIVVLDGSRYLLVETTDEPLKIDVFEELEKDGEYYILPLADVELLQRIMEKVVEE